MALHVFGLTGGIGSGKSQVSARFRARGLPVIDADALAREAVEPGTPALSAIVEAFGPGVLQPDGALDRKRLAAVVFADDAARRTLNGITHPRVRDLMLERTRALAEQGEPLACYEVPLLVESGMAELFRPLVVVAADEATQIARTRARDGATDAEARARVRAQLPLDEKTRLADLVIDNSGTLDELARRADHALDQICAKLGVDPARYPRPD
ncbi:MAG: dephospho-CoA kinase [Sorangiineae bacterium]|nr:dephospho-CoA kinase [Polyangiaceae bacterium]MEB2323943.1 dephospho-CoA kinase [Sorangiineae bacterium]